MKSLPAVTVLKSSPSTRRRTTGSIEGDLHETLSRLGETLTGEQGRMLLGLAGRRGHPPPGAQEAVRVRFGEPLNQNVAVMVARAAERGDIPAPVDAQAAVAIILGPLHDWLLTGYTFGPSALDALTPMVLRALRAGPTGR